MNDSSSSIFTTLGLDPFRTEPDQLFSLLSVKQVETYRNAVRQAATSKESELRELVGERYQDLLGTANTIIGMANSSEQLCDRLGSLQAGITAFDADTSTKHAKAARKISTLSAPRLPGDHLSPNHKKSAVTEEDEQEQIYSLGASLKMIMDAPEHVWRSIEKGRTLHAAWAFMLARTVWWDLMERSPAKHKVPSASSFQVDVKSTFPFIEKQWQGLVPMRKQIVQRAVHLLADPDLGFAAVADQLCAVMLLDNTKVDQTFLLLLSQRQFTLKSRVTRRNKGSKGASPAPRRRSSVTFQELSKGSITSITSKDKAAEEHQEEFHTNAAIQGLVRGFSSTLVHALRCFLLPQNAPASGMLAGSEAGAKNAAGGPQPYLIETMQRLMQSPALHNAQDPSNSPRLTRRISILASPHLEKNQSLSVGSSATLRNACRRSSYGFSSLNLPPASASASHDSGDAASLTPTKPRVSTYDVLHSLPSSALLLRFLPTSIFSFTPYVDLDPLDDAKLQRLHDDLKLWSEKVRSELVTSANKVEGVTALLQGVSSIGSISRLRAAAANTLAKCVPVSERKMSKYQGLGNGWGDQALKLLKNEMQRLKADLDTAFQSRLEGLYEAAIEQCKDQTTAKVDEILARLQKGGAAGAEELGDMVVSNSLLSLFSDDAAPHEGDASGELHSTQLHLSSLDAQLAGRSLLLESVTKPFDSSLTRLQKETTNYTSATDLDASAGSSIQKRFQDTIRVMLQDLFQQLEERVSDADNPASSMKTEIQPSKAFLSRLSSLLVNSAVLRDIFANEAGMQELRGLSERLVKKSLAEWRQAVLSACTETAAVDGKSEQALLAALSLLSDSVLKAGVAIETDSVVREVLQALGDADIVKWLLGKDEGQVDVMARIGIILAPLSRKVVLSPLTMLPGGSGKKVEEITPLATQQLERFKMPRMRSDTF